MKPTHIRKTLTFGDLITDAYNAHGKRRAKGILRLALEAQLVVFHGRNRYVLTGGHREA